MIVVQGLIVQQRSVLDDTQDIRQRWWTSGRQRESWSGDRSAEIARHRWWRWYV